MLWYGELTTRPRLQRRGLMLALAAGVWLMVFLLLPSLLLVGLAFAKRGSYGVIEWSFTLENLKRLWGYDSYGWSANNLLILGRSLWMGLVTTAISLALAYPLAFFIATRRQRLRYTLLALVMVPFCTNMVIRTYAWMLLLSKDLPLAKLATFLGLLEADSSLYPGQLAVYLGMVSSFLPFAVLPLYTNVERMDWSIVEAAQDLYATRWRTFRHAVLPQTIPGLSAALILTFIPAMGTFVVPDLLGGGNYWMIGNLIQYQFDRRELPYGSAVSFALMAMTLLVLFIFRGRARKPEAIP